MRYKRDALALNAFPCDSCPILKRGILDPVIDCTGVLSTIDEDRHAKDERGGEDYCYEKT